MPSTPIPLGEFIADPRFQSRSLPEQQALLNKAFTYNEEALGGLIEPLLNTENNNKVPGLIRDYGNSVLNARRQVASASLQSAAQRLAVASGDSVEDTMTRLQGAVNGDIAPEALNDEENAFVMDYRKAMLEIAPQYTPPHRESGKGLTMFSIDTPNGTSVGAASAFRLNGKSYMDVIFDTDENGQPLDNPKNRQHYIVDSGTKGIADVTQRLGAFTEEKKKVDADIAALESEIRGDGKDANRGFFDRLVDAGADPYGATSRRDGLMFQLRLLRNKSAELDGKIKEYSNGSSAYGAMLSDIATDKIKTNPDLLRHIPHGSNFVMRTLQEANLATWEAYTGTVAGAQYLTGFKDAAKRTMEFQEKISAVREAEGMGQTAFEGGVGGSILRELPGELLQTFVDLGIGHVITKGGTTLLRAGLKARAGVSAAAGSGELVTNVAERMAERAVDDSAKWLSKKFGRFANAIISSAPGALEEASGVISKVAEADALDEQAAAIEEQLKSLKNAGGESGVLAQSIEFAGSDIASGPDAVATLEALAKELRDRAEKMHNGAAFTFFAQIGATMLTDTFGLERILRRGGKPLSHSAAVEAVERFAGERGIAMSKEAAGEAAGTLVKNLEEMSVEFFNGTATQGLLKRIENGAFEGTTEVLQGILNNASIKAFMDEHQEVFQGSQAMSEFGVGFLVSALLTHVSSKGNAAMVHQAIKETGDRMYEARKQSDGVFADATEKLTKGEIAGFGSALDAKDVVKESGDGKWTIDDPLDVASDSAPMGLFSSLRFDTREKAEAGAKTRWRDAFNAMIDTDFASQAQSVDGADSETQRRPVTQRELDGLKEAHAIMASSAAAGSGTSTETIYAAWLNSMEGYEAVHSEYSSSVDTAMAMLAGNEKVPEDVRKAIKSHIDSGFKGPPKDPAVAAIVVSTAAKIAAQNEKGARTFTLAQNDSYEATPISSVPDGLSIKPVMDESGTRVIDTEVESINPDALIDDYERNSNPMDKVAGPNALMSPTAGRDSLATREAGVMSPVSRALWRMRMAHHILVDTNRGRSEEWRAAREKLKNGDQSAVNAIMKSASDKAAADVKGSAMQRSSPRRPVQLTGDGIHHAKDQAKASLANKFIGRGSPKSSAARYAEDYGAGFANTGTYEAGDVVMISAEGNGPGQIAPDFEEINRAVEAGASLITSNAKDRSYNSGESLVADHLRKAGYHEAMAGNMSVWTRGKFEEDVSTRLNSGGKVVLTDSAGKPVPGTPVTTPVSMSYSYETGASTYAGILTGHRAGTTRHGTLGRPGSIIFIRNPSDATKGVFAMVRSSRNLGAMMDAAKTKEEKIAVINQIAETEGYSPDEYRKRVMNNPGWRSKTHTTYQVVSPAYAALRQQMEGAMFTRWVNEMIAGAKAERAHLNNTTAAFLGKTVDEIVTPVQWTDDRTKTGAAQARKTKAKKNDYSLNDLVAKLTDDQRAKFYEMFPSLQGKDLSKEPEKKKPEEKWVDFFPIEKAKPSSAASADGSDAHDVYVKAAAAASQMVSRNEQNISITNEKLGTPPTAQQSLAIILNASPGNIRDMISSVSNLVADAGDDITQIDGLFDSLLQNAINLGQFISYARAAAMGKIARRVPGTDAATMVNIPGIGDIGARANTVTAEQAMARRDAVKRRNRLLSASQMTDGGMFSHPLGKVGPQDSEVYARDAIMNGDFVVMPYDDELVKPGNGSRVILQRRDKSGRAVSVNESSFPSVVVQVDGEGRHHYFLKRSYNGREMFFRSEQMSEPFHGYKAENEAEAMMAFYMFAIDSAGRDTDIETFFEKWEAIMANGPDKVPGILKSIPNWRQLVHGWEILIDPAKRKKMHPLTGKALAELSARTGFTGEATDPKNRGAGLVGHKVPFIQREAGEDAADPRTPESYTRFFDGMSESIPATMPNTLGGALAEMTAEELNDLSVQELVDVTEAQRRINDRASREENADDNEEKSPAIMEYTHGGAETVDTWRAEDLGRVLLRSMLPDPQINESDPNAEYLAELAKTASLEDIVSDIHGIFGININHINELVAKLTDVSSSADAIRAAGVKLSVEDTMDYWEERLQQAIETNNRLLRLEAYRNLKEAEMRNLGLSSVSAGIALGDRIQREVVGTYWWGRRISPLKKTYTEMAFRKSYPALKEINEFMGQIAKLDGRPVDKDGNDIEFLSIQNRLNENGDAGEYHRALLDEFNKISDSATGRRFTHEEAVMVMGLDLLEKSFAGYERSQGNKVSPRIYETMRRKNVQRGVWQGLLPDGWTMPMREEEGLQSDGEDVDFNDKKPGMYRTPAPEAPARTAPVVMNRAEFLGTKPPSFEVKHKFNQATGDKINEEDDIEGGYDSGRQITHNTATSLVKFAKAVPASVRYLLERAVGKDAALVYYSILDDADAAALQLASVDPAELVGKPGPSQIGPAHDLVYGSARIYRDAAQRIHDIGTPEARSVASALRAASGISFGVMAKLARGVAAERAAPMAIKEIAEIRNIVSQLNDVKGAEGAQKMFDELFDKVSKNELPAAALREAISDHVIEYLRTVDEQNRGQWWESLWEAAIVKPERDKDALHSLQIIKGMTETGHSIRQLADAVNDAPLPAKIEFWKKLIEGSDAARELWGNTVHDLSHEGANGIVTTTDNFASSSHESALVNLYASGWTPDVSRTSRMALFQKDTTRGGLKRGKITFKGNSLPTIQFTKHATVSTFIHEMTHWMNGVQDASGTPILKSMLGENGYAELMNWATRGGNLSLTRTKENGEVIPNHIVEENIATGVEQYFGTIGARAKIGVIPSGPIAVLGQAIRTMWRKVYSTEPGIPRHVRDAFDNVFFPSAMRMDGRRQMLINGIIDESANIHRAVNNSKLDPKERMMRIMLSRTKIGNNAREIIRSNRVAEDEKRLEDDLDKAQKNFVEKRATNNMDEISTARNALRAARLNYAIGKSVAEPINMASKASIIKFAQDAFGVDVNIEDLKKALETADAEEALIRLGGMRPVAGGPISPSDGAGFTVDDMSTVIGAADESGIITEDEELEGAVPEGMAAMLPNMEVPNDGEDDEFARIYYSYTPRANINQAVTPDEFGRLRRFYEENRTSGNPLVQFLRGIYYVGTRIRARGLAPKTIFKQTIIGLGGRDAIEGKALRIQAELEGAISREAARAGLSPAARGARRRQLNELVNRVLANPDQNDRAQALRDLMGTGIDVAALQARDLVDSMMDGLINEGIIFGPMAAVWQRNRGVFLHRTYRFHGASPSASRQKLWAQQARGGRLWDNAVDQLAQSKGIARGEAEAMLDQLLKHIEQAHAENTNAIKSGNLLSSEAVSLAKDPERRRVIENVVNTTRATFIRSRMRQGANYAQASAAAANISFRAVREAMEDPHAQRPAWMNAIFAATVFASDINGAVAEAVGLQTEPQITFLNSIRTMNGALARHRVEAGIRDAGLRNGWIRHINDRANSDRLSAVFTSGGTADQATDPAQAMSMGPLSGYASTPEVVSWVKQMQEVEFGSHETNAFLRTMQTVNGLWKVSKTVFSPATAIANSISAMISGLSIPGLPFKGYGAALGMTVAHEGGHYRAVERVMGTAERDRYRRLFDRLVETGEAEAGTFNEIMDLFTNVPHLASGVAIDLLADNIVSNTGREVARMGIKAATKVKRGVFGFYRYGDLFFKLAAISAETDNLAKSFPGMSEEERINLAADRVGRAMFSFRREPYWMRTLKRNVPFFGTFFSFGYGATRSFIQGVAIGAQDLHQGFQRLQAGEAGAVHQIRHGIERLGKLAAVTMGARWLADVINDSFGWDDDRDRAARNLLPSYDQGGVIVWQDHFKPGEKANYVNLARFLPFHVMSGVADLIGSIVAAKGEPTLTARLLNENGLKALNGIIAPFFAETEAMKILSDAMVGKDGSDSMFEQGMSGQIKGTEFAAWLVSAAVKGGFDTLTPGAVVTAAKIFGWNSILEATGNRQKLIDGKPMTPAQAAAYALGWNETTLDHQKALGYKAQKVWGEMDGVKSAVAATITNPNATLEDMLAAAEAGKKRMDELSLSLSLVVDSAQKLGLPVEKSFLALKDSKVVLGNRVGSPSRQQVVSGFDGQWNGPLVFSRRTLIEAISSAGKNAEAKKAAIEEMARRGLIAIRPGR